MISMSFAGLLQTFFTDRLVRQRQASPHTIASYRDAFRLLLRFAQQQLGKKPSALALDDFDAPFIGAFLHHVEQARRNGARTRNVRLAAIHAFFRYVAIGEPTHADRCRRILAIPTKRHERRPIAFLCREEYRCLGGGSQPGDVDRPTGSPAPGLGDPDRAQSPELIHLRCGDVTLGTGAHVRCDGKGRKQRCPPLHRETATLIAAWLRERHGQPTDPVFPSIRGTRLSRDAVERLVTRHANTAPRRCPSLTRTHVSPPVLRHTAAMDLLGHGLDRAVIALWLGHASVETTQMYLHADMRLKEHALARPAPAGVTPGRSRPTDRLLAFLEGL